MIKLKGAHDGPGHAEVAQQAKELGIIDGRGLAFAFPDALAFAGPTAATRAFREGGDLVATPLPLRPLWTLGFGRVFKRVKFVDLDFTLFFTERGGGDRFGARSKLDVRTLGGWFVRRVGLLVLRQYYDRRLGQIQ